jgi:hypothetical protein
MSFLFYKRYEIKTHSPTGDEKEVKKIRMHTGKHLELLCLDQEDGSILGSINLQVNDCHQVFCFTQNRLE